VRFPFYLWLVIITNSFSSVLAYCSSEYFEQLLASPNSSVTSCSIADTDPETFHYALQVLYGSTISPFSIPYPNYKLIGWLRLDAYEIHGADRAGRFRDLCGPLFEAS